MAAVHSDADSLLLLFLFKLEFARISTKEKQKVAGNTFFSIVLRVNAKLRKNRFLDRSPARSDFSLVETPFWNDFRAFRGRGLFAIIFACIGAL